MVSSPAPIAPKRAPRRREPRLARGSLEHRAGDALSLLVGAALVAATFNSLLAPNGIASGGVIGLSLVATRLFEMEAALVQWGFNGAIFALALYFLGKRAALKSALGALLLPFFVLLTRDITPLTTNPLLAAIYGGIGVGVGRAILGLDGAVIALAAFAFDAEKAMFGLIAAFVTAKVIDVVQIGFGFAKVVWVISGETEAISHAILHDLDRGLTKLQGFGGFSGEERTVLMVVVSHHEVARLKALIQTVDPHAFTIVSDTTEVLGQGFKLHH